MSSRIPAFLDRFEDRALTFFKEVQRTRAESLELFDEIAEPMLRWAEMQLGPGYLDTLIDGYCTFVIDVNRSQLAYEELGRYEHHSYQEVYAKTYDSPEFMNLYHWGVYTTTFVWGHHLLLHRFFKEEFLARLPEGQPLSLLDLGAGSGIWHLLALQHRPQLKIQAVDISETSIALARSTAEQSGHGGQVTHSVADALTFNPGAKVQAGLSCFLLEHLETPDRLLANLAQAIEPRGFAFVTCALSAAEVDHIYEMVRESEPIALAEKAGFRLVSLLSASPKKVPRGRRYLPRSMAMVLQKRANDIW